MRWWSCVVAGLAGLLPAIGCGALRKPEQPAGRVEPPAEDAGHPRPANPPDASSPGSPDARGVDLRFVSETILGPRASVMVTARVPGRAPAADQQIEYRLAHSQGRWLVYDVLVDGVSLVDGYHAQFARLIQRDGVARLIDRMQRKLEVSGRY